MFGASFLLSVLPLIILLSALANSRVDDNIATRLGLNREGSHIVDTLFTSSHAGLNFGVVVALALSLLGTIAVRVWSRGSTSKSSITLTCVDGRTCFGVLCGPWRLLRRYMSMR